MIAAFRFPPLPLADIPIWVGALSVIGSFFGLSGIILACMNRRWVVVDARLKAEKEAREKGEKDERERREQLDREARESAAAKMTFEGLNLTSISEAREQWRKDVHDLKETLGGEILALRNQVEELQEDNNQLKSTHVGMYVLIERYQYFFDQLRSRATKDGTITFTVGELPPHVDLENMSPSRNFARKRQREAEVRVTISPPGDLRPAQK